MDAEQQEMIHEFVAESRDMLDSVEPMLINLAGLDDGSQVASTVNEVFGLFHSLKGGAGFLQFHTLKEFTHTAESLLQIFRKNPGALQPHHVDVLTRSCDLMRKMLEQINIKLHDQGFESEAGAVIRLLEQQITQISEGSGPSAKPTRANSPEPGVIAKLPEVPPPSQAAVVAAEAASPTPGSGPVELMITPELDQMEVTDLPWLVNPELRQTFVQEADELLEVTEESLMTLIKMAGEVDPAEHLGLSFRSLHTIKGNAGFLHIPPIEQLAHVAESLLQNLQEGKIPLHERILQGLLRTLDVLRAGVAQISNGSHVEETLFEQAKAELTRLLKGPSLPQLPPASPAATAVDVNALGEASGKSSAIGDILVEMGAVSPDIVEQALERQSTPLGKILIDMGQATPEVVGKALEQQAKIKEKEKVSADTAVKRQDIRIGLDKLDMLINLVGELVISEAMVAYNPDLAGLQLPNFRKATRHHNKNIRELQEIAMSMRMVPVSTTFRKMIRVVHDVTKKVGKQATLELIGEETEMDKTVIEQISDPLLHIIRNAVDHGIDTPSERLAAGKAAAGRITLEARNAGNEVWIVISDDGRGLNRDKILARVCERGLVPPDVTPPNEEIWKLIFEAGFLTAEKVTDLSGRGVGMDVVKRNIENLHGQINIHSEPGKGSTFILRIPLTLAIIEGMLVRVGGSRYVIPIESIRESLRPKIKDVTKTLDGTEMVKIRQELLPIVRLHELHRVYTQVQQLEEGILVVLEDARQRLCLFVDQVIGRQQIVVKALPPYLGEISHVSGCTILGDGGVCFILDVARLINSQDPNKPA